MKSQGGPVEKIHPDCLAILARVANSCGFTIVAGWPKAGATPSIETMGDSSDSALEERVNGDDADGLSKSTGLENR